MIYTKWIIVLAIKLNDIMPMYVELGCKWACEFMAQMKQQSGLMSADAEQAV